jgi:hypothetical protein
MIPMNVYNLTPTSVQNFILTMRFVAEHDLWDEIEAHLKHEGCSYFLMSIEPIAATKKLLVNQRRSPKLASAPARARLEDVIACGCGVAPPGPPGGQPQFPHGGGDGGVLV